jgi:hypothetical protein
VRLAITNIRPFSLLIICHWLKNIICHWLKNICGIRTVNIKIPRRSGGRPRSVDCYPLFRFPPARKMTASCRTELETKLTVRRQTLQWSSTLSARQMWRTCAIRRWLTDAKLGVSPRFRAASARKVIAFFMTYLRETGSQPAHSRNKAEKYRCVGYIVETQTEIRALCARADPGGYSGSNWHRCRTGQPLLSRAIHETVSRFANTLNVLASRYRGVSGAARITGLYKPSHKQPVA